MKRLVAVLALLGMAHAAEAQAVRQVIFNKLMAVGTQDSTALLDMRYPNNAYLLVKLLPAAGGCAVPFAKIGVTVRMHTAPGADSNNTFVWNPRIGANYGGAVDSLNFGNYGSATAGNPQSDEIPVYVTMSHSAPRTVFIPLTGGQWFSGFPRGPFWMSFSVRLIAGCGNTRVQMGIVTAGE